MSSRSIPPAGVRIVLTPQAQSLMEEGFTAGLPAEVIARRIAEIGTRISPRTVARRRAESRMRSQRDEIMARLAQFPKAGWAIDEIIRLFERVDTADGWALRARRRLHRALADFVKEPDEQRIRRLSELCAAYALSFRLGRRPRLVRKQEQGETRRAV